MRPYIANGILSLGARNFEPYYAIRNEFTLGGGYEGEAMFKSTTIYGLSNYTIRQAQ